MASERQIHVGGVAIGVLFNPFTGPVTRLPGVVLAIEVLLW